jgi:prepilin-type N-terminal cleavage/methylation domain-containing protein
MRFSSRFRAFTLIELLIVVAIIAILAAIAVPNFMEAQTRSKVSRSVADMRSLATALEAYAVDNNKYPVIPAYPNYGWDLPAIYMKPLTTPVAFITSLPKYTWKPFTLDWGNGPFVVDYYYYEDYVSFYSPGGLPWTIWDVSGNSRWYLSAAGPDGDLDQDWTGAGSNNQPYDATNGTMSSGDLIRVGP